MASPIPAQIQNTVRLHMAGRLDEAERAYRAILTAHPDEPNCTHLLGLLLAQRGYHVAAELLLRRSLELASPGPADWHSNYAMFCRDRGRREEALTHLRRAIEMKPSFTEAHDNLGLVLEDLNRFDEAKDAFEAAVSANPAHFPSRNHLAQNLHRRGRTTEAIKHWQRAVELQPASADAHVSLGCALIATGEKDQAMSHFQQAMQLQPRNVLAITNVAWGLYGEGRLNEAISLCRQAIQIDPNDGHAWLKLGIISMDLGDFDQAISCYRRALAIQPSRADWRSNLLLTLHYVPNLPRKELFEEHCVYQRVHVSECHTAPMSHTNDRDPNRRLRIGYVSPDFRRHPVASFIEPVLRAHDRSSFIVSCYSSVKPTERDTVTSRLQGYASEWHDVDDLTDKELARLINRNREDILIDLSGHTANTRLLAFAHKPAPVQISYLGYLNTTGLDAMDYRLTDAMADPPGKSEAFYTERLLRLPCFFCYEPLADAPLVGALPAGQSGGVTFGSMNHPGKFNAHVLDVWAKLLMAVPDSRLWLMANRSVDCEGRMRDLLVQWGVAPERVSFSRRLQYGDYLAAYHKIDIALDPFPFGGHTTTCDAIWMGVPVVTMPGESYASRLTASVLTHLGITELIARDEAQYIQIAGDLAQDRARLAGMRDSLRQRMRDSVITHAAVFTASLEQAYRDVWRRCCTGG